MLNSVTKCSTWISEGCHLENQTPQKVQQRVSELQGSMLVLLAVVT